MSNLKVLDQFSFAGNGVRVIMQNESPWFVVADIARVLEYSNPSKLLTGLRDTQKANVSLGSGSPATIISESGLYSILIRSRMAKARPFRIWVEDEVLPSIRKTGAYVTPGVNLAPQPAFLAALQNLQLQNQNLQEQNMLVLQGLGQIQELALAADVKADTALARITEFETEREAFQARLDSFDAPTVEAPEETPRAKIQKIVSGISRLTGRDHRRVFGELYYDFRLRYHIDLPARAKAFKHKTTIEFAEAAGYIDDLYSMAYATLQKLKANAN